MGKTNKKKKSSNQITRPLPEVEEGQYYCVCTKALGDKRFVIKFPDGKERKATLSGRIKRGAWVSDRTWVIASVRTFEPDATAKADIIEVLTSDEVRILKKRGDIDGSLEGRDRNEEDTSYDMENDDLAVDIDDI